MHTMHGPGAGSTFPCAPIDAGRGLVVGHAGRGAAPRGVCGRRRAERRPRSRAEFESRIPAFTPSPLPWHHPCPPLLQSTVLPNGPSSTCVRPPTHGSTDPAPPQGANTSGAAQRGARCVVVVLKSMLIWFSSRGAREVTTSMSAPAHQQGHSQHVGANEGY